MRRPAKGGTTHPTETRPGMGYGRPLRARPGPVARVELVAELAAFLRGERTEIAEAETMPRSEARSSVTGLDLKS